LGDYEAIRTRFRNRVIEAKRVRRVTVSPHLTVVFENRDTVLLQIQEMLRTERITSESGILHELETYNELIPAACELSMTLYVEIIDRADRDHLLVTLVGLEDHLQLEVDGVSFAAVGKRPEAIVERTTAVHYLKFPLSMKAAVSLRTRQARAAIVVSHPRYAARVELSTATLATLAEDLAE
jgi:hypothetical protein